MNEHPSKSKRYLVYLSNIRSGNSKLQFSPKDATYILYKARNLVREYDTVLRDVRISSKFIEIDVNIPANHSINTILDKIGLLAPTINAEVVEERNYTNSEAISKSIDFFNNEKFWSAHETLESIWKKSSGVEKDILNGLILISAAFVHNQKDESSICISILKRALEKLSLAGGKYHDINLDDIKNRTAEIISTGEINYFTI